MDDSILLECSIPNLFYHFHDRLEIDLGKLPFTNRYSYKIFLKASYFSSIYTKLCESSRLQEVDVEWNTQKKNGSWILSKNCIHGSIEFPLALFALQIVKSTLSLVKAKNIVVDIYLCSRNRRTDLPLMYLMHN